MPGRIGSPVWTVLARGRYFAVSEKLVATTLAKRERNSTALPGTVFASWRTTGTEQADAASTGGSEE